MMTNEEASKFVFNSYVTAFEVGKERMINKYFAADLEFYNHSVAKKFSLSQIKSSILRVHKKYQNLKSMIKDVIVEGERIAFHAEQNAFFVPNNEYVNMNVMNLYLLADGKVKAWQLWFAQNPISQIVPD